MTIDVAGRRPHDVLALVTRPGSWSRVRVFGAAARSDHIRRQVDTITLALEILVYRLVTFYLPPTWGYVALRSLRQDGFL